MKNPLNVLGGNLGDCGEFCKGLGLFCYWINQESFMRKKQAVGLLWIA
ncbi:hypothetical protein [Neisseria weaveri]|nr:hypothetical protein [Neisseria weaveri]